MMNVRSDHSTSGSGSGSSEGPRQRISPWRGGGDEGAITDRQVHLDWDPYADAGYDTRCHNNDFRWIPWSSSEHSVSPVSNARFLGTFENDNETEFQSLASSEYFSVDDDDDSPMIISENQQVKLTFPKMAVSLNLDVTVSDIDPATGKLELACSVGDGMSRRNGNITHCEMWLNEQYLQNRPTRSSSSEIALTTDEPLFSESENFSSENLKSSSDSKLSLDTKTSKTNDGICMKPMQGRKDHVQETYHLMNFSDEEENDGLKRQIEESSTSLDRLIAWYNNGCGNSFESRDWDPELTQESVNKTDFKEERREADIVCLSDTQVFPSPPSSPLSSSENVEKPSDSASDKFMMDSRNYSSPLNGSRPSWLTIYKSNTQFERVRENGNTCSELSSLSEVISSIDESALIVDSQSNHLDFSETGDDSEDADAFLRYSEEEGIECSPAGDTSKSTLSHILNDVHAQSKCAMEDLFATENRSRMKNNSSSTIFDSTLQAMLQEVGDNTIPDTKSKSNFDQSSTVDVVRSSEEDDRKPNEEKLRVLGLSYGLLDDSDEFPDYDSDSDDDEVSVVERKSPPLSDDVCEVPGDSSVVSDLDSGRHTDENQIPSETDTSGSWRQTPPITSSSNDDKEDISCTSISGNSYENSENDLTAKSRSTFQFEGSLLFQKSNTSNLFLTEEIQQRLNEHRKRQTFDSDASLFSFNDEDQIDFLGKFQCYIESLDIGILDHSSSRSQDNVSGFQAADGYFSSLNEDQVMECSLRKFLGNHVDHVQTEKGEAINLNNLNESSDLLNNMARSLATRIISDLSLCQEKPNSSNSSVSDATVENRFSSEQVYMRSSEESLGKSSGKSSTEGSSQNVRPISSSVFSCPYFDDIARLDVFPTSADEARKWPISSTSVNDLGSRSHSQIIDLLNTDKHAQLINYSLNVYEEEDDDVQQLSLSDRIKELFPEDKESKSSESQHNSDCDVTDGEDNSTDQDTDQTSAGDDKDEQSSGSGGTIESPMSDKDMARMPSDRFSFCVDSGTFIQHEDYDTNKRDTSKGIIMAEIERDALAQYACLLVKGVISSAQKKFIWSMNGGQEKDKNMDASQSSLLESSSSVQEIGLAENQTFQIKLDKRETSRDELTHDKSKKCHSEGTSSVPLQSCTSSLDYCRTVVAAGLSSIAIREGMNELRLVACKEWHNRRHTSTSSTDLSSKGTDSSESEPEVDNYTKYKSKLRELKMRRQRGGGRWERNQENATKTTSAKTSSHYWLDSDISSDEDPDDDSNLNDGYAKTECEKNTFQTLFRKNSEITMLEMENILNTERMLLRARHAHHLRRLERYKEAAESSSPSSLCPEHNDSLPVSMRSQDNICVCIVEKAEALRSIAREILRGFRFLKTQYFISKMEGELMEMRKRVDAGQDPTFNKMYLDALIYMDNSQDQMNILMQIENNVLKSFVCKNLEDFTAALDKRLRSGPWSWKKIKENIQDADVFETVKEMKEFKEALDIRRNTTKEIKNNLNNCVHPDGSEYSAYKKTNSSGQQLDKTDFEESEPAMKKHSDVSVDITSRLTQYAERVIRLDKSRQFLTEEYKQLKDNRLGVDLAAQGPTELSSTEGDIPPLMAARCSICKLRKKVNKADTNGNDQKLQTTKTLETENDSPTTVKRFGGHEYEVVTGCGIRKHTLTCELCKAMEDVGV